MTNQIKSTKKNKIVEAPAISGLVFLAENDLGKAQAIFAIRSLLDKLQASAEGLAKLEANDILPLLDLMREVFGAQATDNFYKVSTEAIGSATEAIQNTRETINAQLDKTQSGDLSPTNDMASDDAGMDMGSDDDASMDMGGGDEGDMSMGDAGEEPDEDAFDLDSDEGMSAAGRPRKESIRYNVKALQESRNPDAMILNAYRKSFRESRQATRAVRAVAESFAIDLADVIDIVQEAAKAVDEGKTWKDEKGKSSKNKDFSKDREQKKKSREDAEEVAEGKTFKDEKGKSNKNKDFSKERESKKRERPSDIDEAKKPDADKDGIPNWADENPFKAGGKEDRKPSKKS